MNEADKLQLQLDVRNVQISSAQRIGAVAATGAIVTHAENIDDEDLTKHFDALREFLRPLKMTTGSYFAGSLLYNVISQTEIAFVEVIRLVLSYYPKKIGSIEFKLSEVVDKPRQEILLAAADRYLNSLMYKRPTEYLSELCKILSINKENLEECWGDFIEAKARRDLGIHNAWVVNETYIRKVAEVGETHIAEVGENICPEHDNIHRVMPKCEHLVNALCDQIILKYA
ncbi:MAG: hypothetical protein GVY36_18345 [Verrucomicrobia bacterium]|jgi:hypothetical protein|nr:hypothetical protein [Verrucomicrobiota bacterium]